MRLCWWLAALSSTFWAACFLAAVHVGAVEFSDGALWLQRLLAGSLDRIGLGFSASLGCLAVVELEEVAVGRIFKAVAAGCRRCRSRIAARIWVGSGPG